MNILLFIHNQSDLDALPEAAERIIRCGYRGIWALYSPAICVDQAATASQYDADIASLQSAQNAAVQREDFEAAQGLKAQRQAKETDRATALLNAWKAIVPEQRASIAINKLTPFIERAKSAKLNVKITPLPDHYDAPQFVAMLNALSGAWFEHFKHGHYVMAWPGAIPAPVSAPVAPTAPPSINKFIAKNVTIQPEKPAPRVFSSRKEELTVAPYMKLRSIGRKLGIETDKRPRAEVVAEILEKEASTVPA